MNFDLAERNAEVSAKLAALRTASGSNTALRLRGSDWFAWATAGASNVVLLTTETGIAELLITAQDAWVLTDEIEAQRLIDEELPSIFKIQIQPWAVPAARETAVQELLDGATVLSDRPRHTEKSLPAALLACKRNMSASEITRYRQVGRLTSAAMCEVLRAARPEWSEYQLAGAGAEALWARGLHPALTLAAGEQRLPIYRHPTASSAKLGSRAMLVFCARGFGLYANLTRFVSFAKIPPDWLTLQQQVGEIEAQALEACRPGVRLNEIYQILATAYRTHGHTSAINEHHQGGTTGYMAREIVATPDTFETLSDATPIAWNPSLRGGAKIEDTFIVTANGLEDMTYDATWPYALVHGRLRPQVLEQ
jgi:Xaa-Pro aminopeptidase